ncbi:MAG: T9SS type A sorting domain-containing protein [Bacteroidales bacterium]|nr:T9SS type A sorting domain-containing protein [Bacteroidales bacterium]
MKNQILLIILCLGFWLFYLDSYSQITRGAQPAELYLSTDWYMDNYGHIHYAIFHSVDNGATITLQYESSTSSPPGVMSVGKVLGDATIGAVYNVGGNEIWVSFNFGENWNYREDYQDYTRYWGGENDGAIYKGGWGLLQKSNDYALTFEVVSDPPNCPISDIGVFDGEFYGIDGNAGEGFFLYHTNDYAINYTEIPIDSSVAFWAPGGIWPKISRGTEPGELYLVSWWLDSSYKIFHSTDTGYTWTEKFESDYIDIFYWRVKYTAGREPGSFYVMRSRINPAGDHVWLYIDYSNDYGETFTTYFHDLDSTITTVNTLKTDNIKLSNFPNPFTGITNIYYKLEKEVTVCLIIYDYSGRRLQTNRGKGDAGINKVQFDSSGLPSGIYFYNLEVNGQVTDSKKMAVMK